MYHADPFLRIVLILLGLRHIPGNSGERTPRPFFPDYLRLSDIPPWLGDATLAWREEFAPLPLRARVPAPADWRSRHPLRHTLEL
ncbi:hypothetical protein [Chitinilyticum litopenaei]|uniref:hypothetical protein n=1 Tax=Chitinilyticum litopenaei TaxID=1121276 RepID=UPI000421BB4C|nr:hypothetical protein [Chitinilyticum litopenaei]